MNGLLGVRATELGKYYVQLLLQRRHAIMYTLLLADKPLLESLQAQLDGRQLRAKRLFLYQDPDVVGHVVPIAAVFASEDVLLSV